MPYWNYAQYNNTTFNAEPFPQQLQGFPPVHAFVPAVEPGSPPRHPVIRGVSSGGGSKPPRRVPPKGFHYVPLVLDIESASVEEICSPEWSPEEIDDGRRIVRVERRQVDERVVVSFSILGAACHHPITLRGPKGVDVLEVSCLECYTSENDNDSDRSTDSNSAERTLTRRFYITSVEVVKLVEMIIGNQPQDIYFRSRERGRIRSNLMDFWGKKAVSTRRDSEEDSSIVQFAYRIMNYDRRKPRGADKDVRILRWEVLSEALKRALQRYYVELPDDPESHAQEN